MAEKPENSVLFSLKELRRIEDDRVTQEEQDARARAQQEQQAREDAARLAREQEEAALRAQQEAARAEEQALVGAAREEQLRLQEAEARARVEAQSRLEEERMRLEMEGSNRGMPKWVVPAIIVVVLLAGGVLGYLFAVYLPAKEAAQKQAEAARIEKMRKEQEAATKALMAKEAALQKQLANSKNLSGEELEKLKKKLAKIQEDKANASTAAASSTSPMRRRRYYGGSRRRTPSRRPAMRARKPSRRPNALEGLFQ